MKKNCFVPYTTILNTTILMLVVVFSLFVSGACSKVFRRSPVLTIHYYRYNSDYSGWNVWVWPADNSGGGLSFSFTKKADRSGFVTARVNLPDGVPAKNKEIGMIIRKSENGNDWAEKDGNGDRFTGEKEVWLVQGDPAVYTKKPATGKPPILFAAADSPTTVLVSLMKEPADYGVFAVYDGERPLAGSSAKAAAVPAVDAAGAGAAKTATNSGALFQAVITLSEKITDPAKLYTVRDKSGAAAETKLTMRGILDNFYYAGNDLGLTYSAAESGFKVWAPTARSLSVAVYENAGKYNAAGMVTDNEGGILYPMEKDANTGVWSAAVKGNLAGKFYLYRVEFADGKINWAADPYAKAVSANGQRMAVINLADTNPPRWKGGAKPPFAAGAWQDAVIYELHVRDFSIDENSGMKHKGKFLAFTERGTTNSEGVPTGLDHLSRLGITHVHLLPVFDFASVNELTVDDPAQVNPKYNWGYDPMHYNVPEGSYSTDPENPVTRITEFKAMVHSLHDAGIRVIMDVVFNHTYQSGGWPFDSLVPGYYYRTTGTGAYANGSGCGNEVASERPMVRKFIIDSCLYWAQEYNIDGFRFDLMGLIDTPTMQQLTETLRREADPSIIVYGEPWQAGGSVLPENLQTLPGAQKGLGFAVFNDRIRTAIKGGSDDPSKGFASGAGGMEEGIVKGITGSITDFTFQANESINYVTAHDNLNLWDKFALSFDAKNLAANPYGLLEGAADIFDCDAVKAALLANGIVLTSQGIPFFQAGDEMLRSKAGDHNSYCSGDSVNKIRWENAGRFGEIIDYHAGLLRLRREHPAFRMNSPAEIQKKLAVLESEEGGVSFVLKENAANGKERSIFVAYNGSRSSKTFALPNQEGIWKQTVDERRAGTKTLAERSLSVTLPPLSMAVLLKD